MAVPRLRAEHALTVGAELGEGPVWDERTRSLLFVDITGAQVHRYVPSSGQHTAFPTGAPVGAVVLREDGGLLLARHDRFSFAGADGSAITDIAGFRVDGAAVRFNDGKVDPRGSFVAGTMDTAGRQPLGGLYQLDRNGQVATLLEPVVISNGLAWDRAGTTLYYIDTPRQKVDAFDVDPEHGTLSDRRTVVELPDTRPDGMAIDDEGFLWVACWGGGRVDRYRPSDGRLIGRVAVPTPLVSSVAFGGAGLDELYVTTARSSLGDTAPPGDEHAGDLFVAHPGVTGPLPFRFGGVPAPA